MVSRSIGSVKSVILQPHIFAPFHANVIGPEFWRSTEKCGVKVCRWRITDFTDFTAQPATLRNRSMTFDPITSGPAPDHGGGPPARGNRQQIPTELDSSQGDFE